MIRLTTEAQNQLFHTARTHSRWLAKEVPDSLLHELYDVLKWAPTAANTNPLRIVFVKTADAKERLKPCLDKGNVEKTMSAPVTAILAYDMEFYEKLPKLFPHADARSWYAGKPAAIEANAIRNGTLQGGYFILAARALGLDCGPMSGFNQQAVDEAFFAGTAYRSNFLCNLGYGDASALHPRLPRLEFAEACQIV